MNQSDHDMLLRIDENVGILVKRANNHGARIRILEVFRNIVIGGALVVGFLLYAGRDIAVEWVKVKLAGR